MKEGIRKLKFNQQLKKAEGSKTPKVELTVSIDGVAIHEPKTKVRNGGHGGDLRGSQAVERVEEERLGSGKRILKEGTKGEPVSDSKAGGESRRGGGWEGDSTSEEAEADQRRPPISSCVWGSRRGRNSAL